MVTRGGSQDMVLPYDIAPTIQHSSITCAFRTQHQHLHRAMSSLPRANTVGKGEDLLKHTHVVAIVLII